MTMDTGGGRRCVLVVEDDTLVRILAVEMLLDAGHVVHEASNARGALRLLTCMDDIDVVFTDVSMPIGMDGIGLAATIARRWPHVMVVLTSGGRRLRMADLPPHGQFLAKPYLQADVLAAISA